MSLSDRTLYDIESVLFAATVVGFALWLLVAMLRRSRADLSIGHAVAAAVALRIGAAVALPLLGLASSLRGGDEGSFLFDARAIAEGSFFSDASLDALASRLHVWLFSLQIRVLDAPDLSLRVVHIGIAVAGLTFLAAAVYELAGPRAATIAAWILAVEPASVFFSGLLHKESLMILGGGLVVYGGARLWTRRDVTALAPMILGSAIAVASRPYAGWFLVAAAMAITLHASLTRRGERQAPALVLAAVMAFLIALSLPTVLEQSSDENLQTQLQPSQEANTQDTRSNLGLERVDYSTRSAVIVNLPQRMRDVIFRPYLWQVGNTSQRLGVLGTIFTLALLFFLARAVIDSPRDVMARAGPIVYTVLFLLIAYALSAGNAGTGFRYRTHLVTLAICLVVVLRERFAEQRAQVAAAPAVPRVAPAPAFARPR